MSDHWQHFAPAESLDPTPVWKQYIVVAVLLLLSIVLIAAIAVPSVLPQLVTPPAAVPGGRVILARDAIPAAGFAPLRVGPPLVAEDRAFYVQRVSGDLVAVLARWSPGEGEPECRIAPSGPIGGQAWGYVSECADDMHATFGPRGEPEGASRSLARYLVSVDGDRVIVNVSRRIREYGATPQPRVAPLP